LRLQFHNFFIVLKMTKVRPKKYLGQHFLNDLNIAGKIVDSLTMHRGYQNVLEIGPGMGVLTDFLITNNQYQIKLVDIDNESIAYLHQKYSELGGHIIEGDFLKMDLGKVFGEPFAVIGNFPYNISSQIFFKILDHKDLVPEVVGMIQKEVAERLASPPGNKDYGILSVLLQAYYHIEYLFTVKPHVFTPPPKVNSAVIRLTRNEKKELGCDPVLFKRIVKQGFQNRRKTLRNALKVLGLPEQVISDPVLDKRAEQLSVDDFVDLTNKIMEKGW
jgi:16S rRNA (adenine1518-N6/adenine1519-N6)-dimethyltransferase